MWTAKQNKHISATLTTMPPSSEPGRSAGQDQRREINHMQELNHTCKRKINKTKQEQKEQPEKQININIADKSKFKRLQGLSNCINLFSTGIMIITNAFLSKMNLKFDAIFVNTSRLFRKML